MQRTQIYLTEAEQAGLQHLSRIQGTTVSALIREAVDRYLQTAAEPEWRARRLAAFGLWADHADEDPARLRGEERFGDWHDAG
jgi:hypothetical protein